jgi:hypothetical protein
MKPARRRLPTTGLSAGLAAAVALVVLAQPAGAAPTCWDAGGRTVRCEAADALPVGATRPAVAAATLPVGAPTPEPDVLFAMVCVLVSLFGAIAAVPPFDGDWEGRRPPE